MINFLSNPIYDAKREEKTPKPDALASEWETKKRRSACAFPFSAEEMTSLRRLRQIEYVAGHDLRR